MGEHRTFYEHDPELGRTVWLIFDDFGNVKGAHVEQDATKIIEANVEAEKLTHGAKFLEWNRVASVPLTWMEKTGLDVALDMGDNKYISKLLNDSDHAKLRTSRGKV